MPSQPLALLALLLVACTAAEDPVAAPLDLPPGCNPLLAGRDCLLPYPSDHFRAVDPHTTTGYRIQIPASAAPTTDDDRQLDVTRWRVTDGFSRVPTILALLGAPASAEGLPNIFDDPSASVSPSSPTHIIDTVTGARIAHFVDLDPRTEDPERQALVLRPLEGLVEQRRYVVALTGVRGVNADVLPAPEGFRRLRDGVNDPELAELRARYERDIFPLLDAASLTRSELQLAWDFTTGSDAEVTGDMFEVRRLTLEALAKTPPAVAITSVQEAPSPEIFRAVQGTLTGPNFLTSAKPGARLVRNAEGRVIQEGTTTIPFLALIPRSAVERNTPAPFVGYGHGFFGDRYELNNHGTPNIAVAVESVFLSIDWLGMSREDLGTILANLYDDPESTFSFTDRVHQAMANWLVVTAAFDDALARAPAFAMPSGGPRAGEPIYALDEMYFVGISNGHILGAVQAALNPVVRGYSLEVGGAGFSLMMFRALPFGALLFALDLLVSDRLSQQKFAAMGQRTFDRIDPGVYARYVLKEPLPGSPPRRVLLRLGVADPFVPNVASLLHARLLGLDYTTPSPVKPWGLRPTTPPIASAVTIYDLGEDPAFYELATPPAEDNGVHGAVRFLPSALEQLRAFLGPEGEVIHPCSGPCDPD